MALATLVSSFLLFPRLQAQVVPVGSTCTVDDCLLGFIPSYQEGTADWSQITSCIDYQSVPVTSTYTSYVYAPDVTSTLTRIGCPTERAVDWNKRQLTTTTSAVEAVAGATTILPNITASEPCTTLAGAIKPSGCSDEQIASICECALFVSKYSVTQTTTWTATLGNIYYTEEFVSCSTTSSPCPTAGWANTSSIGIWSRSSITGGASVSSSLTLGWSNSSTSATHPSSWKTSPSASLGSSAATIPYSWSGTAASGWSWPSSSSAVGWNSTATASTSSAFFGNTTSSSIASDSTIGVPNTTSTIGWPTVTISFPTAISSVSIPLLTTAGSSADAASVSSSAPPFPIGNSSTVFASGTGVVSSSSWLTADTELSSTPALAESGSPTSESSSSTASSSIPGDSSSSTSTTVSSSLSSSYPDSHSSSTGRPIQITDTAVTTTPTTTSNSASQDATDTSKTSRSSALYASTTSGDLTTMVSVLPSNPTSTSDEVEESSTLTVTRTRTKSIFSTPSQSIGLSGNGSSAIWSSSSWPSISSSLTSALATEAAPDYGYGNVHAHSSTASSTLTGPSSTLVSPILASSSSSCVPSFLNSTWITSGYQAVYAADYTGCAIDPYDKNVGFQLVSTATQEKIVNINGRAQIPRDQADYADAYYTFEQNADICGVFDLVFHWEDETTYFAFDPQETLAVFERKSSFGQQQHGSNNYMTSIWSVDCAGEFRAGTIGGTQLMFDINQGDRKLRVTRTAFVAPKSKRTVRKRAGGVHLAAVPVNAEDIEARKSMKKMLKKTSFNRGQK